MKAFDYELKLQKKVIH